MFKKIIALGVATAALSSMTGCAFAPAGAPIGGLFAGVTTNHAISANPVGAKNGEACAISILNIVTIGDASAATAAKQGGITKIGIVDSNDLNILGIYQSHCSEVHGD